MSQAIEDLFDFPGYWPSKKLGKIADVISPGFPCGDHNQQGEGVPHLRPMNISEDGEIDLSKVKYVEEEYTPLRAGDVLFNNTNSPKLVGKTAHIDLDKEWAHSNHMTRIRDFVDEVYSKWVAHWLQFLFRDGYFRMHCRNHVNQASIGVNFLESKVDVPIPPLPEQRRIVSKIEELFSNLDAGMGDLQTAEQQLERYRLSILQVAVEGRLTADWRETHDPEPADQLLERILEERHNYWEKMYSWRRYYSEGKEPPRGWKDRYSEPEEPELHDDLPDLPSTWQWVSLDQVLLEDLRNGKSVRSREGGFPVLRLNAIEDGEIDTSVHKEGDWTKEEASKFIIERNDFFVARGNGSIDLVGRGGLVVEDDPLDVAFPDTMVRVRVHARRFDPHFLRIAWDSRIVREHLESAARTSAGIYKVNQGDLRSTLLPLPPEDEQKQIVDEVERLLSVADDASDTADREHTRADRLRQSILKQAFSGQLVPHDDGEAPSIPGTSTTVANGKDDQESRSPTTDGSTTEGRSADGDDLLDGIDESNQIEMDI